MKKIYKSLAVAAFALMANVAFGQNLKITSNGNPVANGDVINVPYVVEDYSVPADDYYSYVFKWDPKIEASVKEVEAKLTVTVTSIDAEGFQLCFPMQCQFVKSGESVSSSGEINFTPKDLQIHKEETIDGKDAKPTAGGTIKVKFQSGFDSMEITVNALLEDANSVGENMAEGNQPVAYYTLEGIQVENPTKGIYVARKGGKARLIYKK